ncbi:hypothetical protein MTP99_006150 [Tenebrio molitor]|jgi:hypothetical protein|nr:hypothetical protein MTP99_006150 [Tenebrio molitor]
MCLRRRMSRRGGKIPHPHKGDDGKGGKNNEVAPKGGDKGHQPAARQLDDGGDKDADPSAPIAAPLKVSLLSPLFDEMFESDESSSDDSDDDDDDFPPKQKQ